MNVISKVKVNFKDKQPTNAIDAVMGDVGTRYIKAELAGLSEEISNATARIFLNKPDGKIVYNDCVVDERIIYAPLTSESLAVSGTATYVIELMWESGKLLTSFPNTINIVNTGVDRDATESTNELSALHNVISKANQISGKSPYIGDNGNWYIWQDDNYIDSGVSAKGEKGDKGDDSDGETSGGRKLISRVVLDEDVYSINIEKDLNGNSFCLKNGVIIKIYDRAIDGASANKPYLSFNNDRTKFTITWNDFYFGFTAGNTLGFPVERYANNGYTRALIKMDLVEDTFIGNYQSIRSMTKITNNQSSTINDFSAYTLGYTRKDLRNTGINSIQFTSYSTDPKTFIKKTSVIEVWEVI